MTHGPIKPALLLLFALGAIQAEAQTLYSSSIFGTQGAREYPVWSGSAAGYDGVLRPDGRLLLGGTGYWSTCNCFRITMALVDTACGALDPSFGNGGVKDVQFEGRSICHDLAIQSDGKILACGITAPGNGFSGHKPTVYRLLADGSPDTTFNGTGYHKVPFTAISSGAFWQVFPQADGGVTCVGSSSPNINGGMRGIGAMRFLADGSLDPSFSGDGKVHIDLGALGIGLDYDVGTGVMLPDSSLVAIGLVDASGTQTIGLARFLQDGSVDTTFGTGGLSVSGVAAASNVDAGGLHALVDAAGRILVSGTGNFNNGEFIMARFLPDGSLDATYGNAGLSMVTIAANALGRRMELLPDGSTLQYGSHNWNNGLPRIVKRLPDGTLDTSFGNNGIAAPGGPLYHKVYGGTSLPGGRILAWGNASQITLFSFKEAPDAGTLVSLGPDLVGCNGDTVALDPGAGFVTYAWSTGDTIQTIPVWSPGSFWVEVTTPDECHDMDTVTVGFVQPPPTPVVSSLNGIDLSTSASGDLQWAVGGVDIPGATDSTWTAITNGDYTVTVTDTAGCSSTSAVYTVTTVGVSEHAGPGLVRITPNPARDHLRVDMPDRWSMAEAIGPDGRTWSLDLEATGVISIGGLAPGSYILRLRSADRMAVGRFIKTP